jgi:glycine hydroxymethyltransferase
VAFHEAMQPEFTAYQKAILENALTLATELQNLGLRLVSGGTDNHLMLVDLTKTGVTGIQAAKALDRANIVCNKNEIPFDPLPPSKASGIRLGTPGVTTRGMGKEEMKTLARLIVKVLKNIDDEKISQQVKQEVTELSRRFKVPGISD